MAHEQLTYDDLLRIVELIKASEQFSEFRLKVGDIEVELRRRDAAPLTPALSPPGGETRVRHAPVASAPAPCAGASAPATTAPVASASATPGPRIRSHAAAAWPDDAIVIRAPMVGTFYRAPQPGAAPFVDVGAAVDPATIVCIIEVMKLMNSIPAGAQGIVTHILADDAAAVETGQPLIVLQPAPAAG